MQIPGGTWGLWWWAGNSSWELCTVLKWGLGVSVNWGENHSPFNDRSSLALLKCKWTGGISHFQTNQMSFHWLWGLQLERKTSPKSESHVPDEHRQDSQLQSYQAQALLRKNALEQHWQTCAECMEHLYIFAKASPDKWCDEPDGKRN